MKRLAIVAAAVLFTNAAWAQPQYDLLLKGGHVIDPRNDINRRMDVAITAGKIARVADTIPAGDARRVVDVSGLFVTPGLVDIHVHVYNGADVLAEYSGDRSLPPDGFTFRSGVTTVVDLGSSGWRSFADFKTRVIDRARTRVLAMLNIVGRGMAGGSTIEQNTEDMDPEATAKVARQYPDIIVGIKTAHFTGPEWTAVDRAVAAGTAANIPVAVDFGNFNPARPFEELVTKHLRPGDWYTHMYTQRVPVLRREREAPPVSSRSAQARRQVRRRARRRQLFVEQRDTGHSTGIRARLDLDRSAHRQHERRHEGHDQRDVEDSQPERPARRRDPDVHEQSRDADQATGAGAFERRRRCGCRGAARGRGQIRVPRRSRRAGRRHEADRVRAHAAERERGMGPQRAGGTGLEDVLRGEAVERSQALKDPSPQINSKAAWP